MCEWQKALVSLTAGGSEFTDDPKYCVEFIKGIMKSQHDRIIKLTIENKKLKL